jgi:transcriptional regulator with PAS, ATPase and Fis domain
VALDNARRLETLAVENQHLREEITLQHNMVGESARMQEALRLIAKVAPSESTVLIRGESGTGKELAARAIHQNSPRSDKPFVALNCAAIPETLLESELFGHEKGSFTGAAQQKRGKMEIASGGTLFLDEIGELAPAIQAKLLRAIQEREFERVGGTRPIRVDIRLIAATNRDLDEAAKTRTFRTDLYYRLAVVTLTMPPLRDRREDIPVLANHFVKRYAERCKRKVAGISPEARACLARYDWPGNVRELENAIERAVVVGSSNVIVPEDLPEAILDAAPSFGTKLPMYHEAVIRERRTVILQALERTDGNFTEAAKLLGVHPNYLHRLVNNLNLRQDLQRRERGAT